MYMYMWNEEDECSKGDKPNDNFLSNLSDIVIYSDIFIGSSSDNNDTLALSIIIQWVLSLLYEHVYMYIHIMYKDNVFNRGKE